MSKILILSLALFTFSTPFASQAYSETKADTEIKADKHDHGHDHGHDHKTMPSEEQIAALFDTWNSTLATGDPDAVAKLYASDGVLLPTVSNDVRTTHEEIEDYFVTFLALNPKGVINEQHIHILDDNTAVNSGVYTFTLTQDGEQSDVQARYSYVYEKEGDAWLIKSHHSSAMPE